MVTAQLIAVVFTLAVITGAIVGIMVMRLPADIMLLTAVAALICYGAVDPKYGISAEQGFAGFANPGVITVALLFIVADGLNRTGGMSWIGQRVLGNPKGRVSAQIRTMIPAGLLSSFLNNTTVVALMMPIINDWSRKHRISASHLLLPLSFAAILGGLCTTIGTSTTIVLNSELPPDRQFALLELGLIGLPLLFIGVAWVALTTRWLLPERKPAFTEADDPREYTVEMELDPSSPLVGRTIEQAGLRQLPGVYLMEIDRAGHVMAAVSPQTILQARDHLVFVGVVDSVVDLQKIPGLKPATDQLFKLDSARSHRCLVEAVVSGSYPFLRMTIRESRFRSHYEAAVIAVNRDGQRLAGKIGDIRLQSGDTLLLETTPDFAERQRNSRHFFLVSEVENSTPLQHDKAWIARILMLVFVCGAAVLSWLGVHDAPLLTALPVALLMIYTRCIRAADARRCIDWPVITVMAAGLGIGRAMEVSGADDALVSVVSMLTGDSAWMMLVVVYLLSVTLSNMITAKAAGAITLQVAIAAAASLNADLAPFAAVVFVGSAGSFATPFGYQTNMMVYGPGGYRSSDYLRMGLPLTMLVGLLTVILVPLIWQF